MEKQTDIFNSAEKSSQLDIININDLDLNSTELDLNLTSSSDNISIDLNIDIIDENLNLDIIDFKPILDLDFNIPEQENKTLAIFEDNNNNLINNLKELDKLPSNLKDVKNSALNILNKNYTTDDLSIWQNNMIFNENKKQRITFDEFRKSILSAYENLKNNIYSINNNILYIESLNNSNDLKDALKALQGDNPNLENNLILENIVNVLSLLGLPEDLIVDFQDRVFQTLDLDASSKTGNFLQNSLITEIINVDEKGIYSYKCPICGEIHKSKFFNINLNNLIATPSVYNVLELKKYLTANKIKCVNTNIDLVISPEIVYNLLTIIMKNSIGNALNLTQIFKTSNKKENNRELELKKEKIDLSLLNRNISDWNKNELLFLSKNEEDLYLEAKIDVLIKKIPLLKNVKFKDIYSICKNPFIKYIAKEVEDLRKQIQLLSVNEFEIFKYLTMIKSDSTPDAVYLIDRNDNTLRFDNSLKNIKMYILELIENFLKSYMSMFNNKNVESELNSEIEKLRKGLVEKKDFEILYLKLINIKKDLNNKIKYFQELIIKFASFLSLTVNENLIVPDDDVDLLNLFLIFNNENDFKKFMLNVEYNYLKSLLLQDNLEFILSTKNIYFEENYKQRINILNDYIHSYNTILRENSSNYNLLKTGILKEKDVSFYFVHLNRNIINDYVKSVGKNKSKLFYDFSYKNMFNIEENLKNLFMNVFSSENDTLLSYTRMYDLGNSIFETKNNFNEIGNLLSSIMPEILYDTLDKIEKTINQNLDTLQQMNVFHNQNFDNIKLNAYNVLIEYTKGLFDKSYFIYEDPTTLGYSNEDIEIWGKLENQQSLIKLLEYNINNLNNLYLSVLNLKELSKKNNEALFDLEFNNIYALSLENSIFIYLITFLGLLNSKSIKDNFNKNNLCIDISEDKYEKIWNNLIRPVNQDLNEKIGNRELGIFSNVYILFSILCCFNLIELFEEELNKTNLKFRDKELESKIRKLIIKFYSSN